MNINMVEEGENQYCKFIDTNLYLYSYWWLLIIIQVQYYKILSVT